MQQHTGLQASGEAEKNLRGVFSSQEIRKVGTGTTTRKTVQKVFWFVEQTSDDSIEIQPINTNYIPTGNKRVISMDELLESFSPEPEFYIQSVFPKMQEMEQGLEQGDKCREKGETFSAEHAYGTVLQLDEENVRANFGIGLTYLSRGESDKADNIFERLVHLDAAFTPDHKHLFNDFGINLRKCKMYAQAVTYYQRALELSRDDENIHINLARAQMELGDYTGCIQTLQKAHTISRDNVTVLRFCEWLKHKKLVPAAQRGVVDAILNAKPGAADQAKTPLVSTLDGVSPAVSKVDAALQNDEPELLTIDSRADSL